MTSYAATPDAMTEVGAAFGRNASSQSVFALKGGLGAGKTHWTKGFVKALGSNAAVTSPTFGLVHQYQDGSLPVFHFDFFRMKSAEEVLALGWDEILEEKAVIVVEWADLFPDLFPTSTRWLHFVVCDDGGREVVEVTA